MVNQVIEFSFTRTQFMSYYNYGMNQRVKKKVKVKMVE